ncbi:MAG: LysR family transcriptional regulator [Hyphomicrobiales bacterium]|nr:LysR family transcriptional regulator [Hyphomicrobiales bacterium]
MQDLNDLYMFAQVVEHGGFAPAGRAIGMPKSKLSRRVGELEAQLGVRLIQRSTRKFAVTEIGQEYYRHCVAMLVEAEAAQEVIDRSRSEPQGTVRVSCPPALVCFQVGDMIARFMAANPRVTVHLESTSRRVDLISDGIDVAIRVRFPPIEETDHVMRVLGPSEQRLVASPACLTQLQGPVVPASLGVLPSVGFGPAHRDHVWQLVGPDGATASVPYVPRLVTDDIAQLRSAALAGVGVAQLPMMVVAQDIDAGGLVDVLPDWRPRSGVVHAVFLSRRGLLPAVRSLIDHLGREYSEAAARMR